MISRCSIIGFGSMGKKHAKNAREFGLSVKYWDPDTELCESEFECVRSEIDALEWCDIAVIASPPQFHTSNLESAIFAGRPCLVEKPVSNSDAGLERIANFAEERNILVSVGQNLRYHPAVNFGEACIADGKLGNISSSVSIGASYLPNWRPHQNIIENYAADSRSGGVLFDWVHEVDLLFYLLGDMTAHSAFAQQDGPLKLGSDEQIAITLTGQEGKILSNLLLTYLVNPPLRKTTIMGDVGVLEIDITCRKASLFSSDHLLSEQIDFGGSHNDDYMNELGSFIECVRDQGVPKCTLRDSIQVLRSILKIRQLAGLPLA
jgi:predicted dehydrogenase